jgi:hypothetical protein
VSNPVPPEVRPYATVEELRRTISTEILVAAGLPRTGPLQGLLRPLLWPLARRFGRVISELDRQVAEVGLVPGAWLALSRFVEGSTGLGTEEVPATGPLVLASNHPGSYDALLITAHAAREDLKIIVSDVPVLRALRAAAPHLIYTTAEPHARMAAMRSGARHLKDGGALLVFASARVDPDPAVLPGAIAALQAWLPSLPLFLRQAPETKLVATIVSGVLSPTALQHPLTWLRRDAYHKQFLAEFVQVGQQLLFGRKFGLTPTVRFAPALTAAELTDKYSREDIMAAIHDRARGLLERAGATT